MPKIAVEPNDNDRRRQAQVLSALRAEKKAEARARGGRDEERRWQVTPVAAHLGVSAGQLTRYEDGHTILPTALLRPLARLYGITVGDLLRRLGLLDEEPAVPTPITDELAPEGWSFRGHLEGKIPESDIDALERRYGHLPYRSALAHAEDVLMIAEALRRERALTPRADAGGA